MRTMYRTSEEYAAAALRICKETQAVGEKKPEHFIRVMKHNRGTTSTFSPYGPSEDGLERKNPLIVALGDSVTAGHFEYMGNLQELFSKVESGNISETDVIEITDVRECYLEKFRSLLIDKYEQTSVSTINSGIAGDTMYGMQLRLYRDVIRYQPDLVIINGVLNWGEECGDTDAYRKVLKEVVTAVKMETKADIILLTSNMECPLFTANTKSTLDQRIEVIRNLAEQEEVCLADAYKVWETYKAAGYPIEKLLANGMNHPSVIGHEIYANVLMQLMD